MIVQNPARAAIMEKGYPSRKRYFSLFPKPPHPFLAQAPMVEFYTFIPIYAKPINLQS